LTALISETHAARAVGRGIDGANGVLISPGALRCGHLLAAFAREECHDGLETAVGWRLPL